jgi:hypothetical protein
MAEAAVKRRHLGDFFRYHLIRLHRLAAVSHDIALGVAFGVLVSFTPFIGFHLILCTVLCILFGGSKVASWIGTIVGNPVTFPLFYWADHQIGSWIIGLFTGTMTQVTNFELNLEQLGSMSAWKDLIWPILLGGLFLGPLAALVSYHLTFRFVEMARLRHHERISRAREKRFPGKPAPLSSETACSLAEKQPHAHPDRL